MRNKIGQTINNRTQGETQSTHGKKIRQMALK